MIKQIKSIIKNNILLITYTKLDKAPDNIKAGYVDFKNVAKRYFNTAKNINVLEAMKSAPVRDIFYFLEKDCKEIFENSIPKNILDVGCGSGIYSKFFKRDYGIFRDSTYSGCEIDEELIKICKKINPDKNFFISSADKIEATDNSFDMVFCSGTLHYTLERWKQSIQEMKRVSSKYVSIVRFPVTKFQSTFYVEQHVIGLNGTEKHYFIVINRSEIEKYFKDLGLEILKYDYVSEEYKIKGVDEKIILINYLLKK